MLRQERSSSASYSYSGGAFTLFVVPEIERVDVALWPSGNYKSVEASSYFPGRLGPTRKCGRRTSTGIGLVPKVHGCDKAVVHRENMDNFVVR